MCPPINTLYASSLLYDAGQINSDEAIALLGQEQSALVSTVKELRKRLQGTIRVSAFGKIDANLNISKVLTPKQLLAKISQSTEVKKRSLIYQFLKKRPPLIRGVILEIPPSRFFEAISNLSKSDILRSRQDILDSLLDMFISKFQTLKGTERTLFRKAVTHVEEELYG